MDKFSNFQQNLDKFAAFKSSIEARKLLCFDDEIDYKLTENHKNRVVMIRNFHATIQANAVVFVAIFINTFFEATYTIPIDNKSTLLELEDCCDDIYTPALSEIDALCERLYGCKKLAKSVDINTTKHSHNGLTELFRTVLSKTFGVVTMMSNGYCEFNIAVVDNCYTHDSQAKNNMRDGIDLSYLRMSRFQKSKASFNAEESYRITKEEIQAAYIRRAKKRALSQIQENDNHSKHLEQNVAVLIENDDIVTTKNISINQLVKINSILDVNCKFSEQKQLIMQLPSIVRDYRDMLSEIKYPRYYEIDSTLIFSPVYRHSDPGFIDFIRDVQTTGLIRNHRYFPLTKNFPNMVRKTTSNQNLSQFLSNVADPFAFGRKDEIKSKSNKLPKLAREIQNQFGVTPSFSDLMAYILIHIYY